MNRPTAAPVLSQGVADVHELKHRIELALPGSSAEIEDTVGDGNHFRAVITAPQFAGLSRIDQHRMVNEIFGGELGGSIHALSIKTQVLNDAQPSP